MENYTLVIDLNLDAISASNDDGRILYIEMLAGKLGTLDITLSCAYTLFREYLIAFVA